MRVTRDSQADHELAARVAKLWPHRKHEANSMFALLCQVGVHCWRSLDLEGLVSGRDVHHCFWCSKVKIDGVIYDV